MLLIRTECSRESERSRWVRGSRRIQVRLVDDTTTTATNQRESQRANRKWNSWSWSVPASRTHRGGLGKGFRAQERPGTGARDFIRATSSTARRCARPLACPASTTTERKARRVRQRAVGGTISLAMPSARVGDGSGQEGQVRRVLPGRHPRQPPEQGNSRPVRRPPTTACIRKGESWCIFQTSGSGRGVPEVHRSGHTNDQRVTPATPAAKTPPGAVRAGSTDHEEPDGWCASWRRRELHEAPEQESFRDQRASTTCRWRGWARSTRRGATAAEGTLRRGDHHRALRGLSPSRTRAR